MSLLLCIMLTPRRMHQINHAAKTVAFAGTSDWLLLTFYISQFSHADSAFLAQLCNKRLKMLRNMSCSFEVLFTSCQNLVSSSMDDFSLCPDTQSLGIESVYFLHHTTVVCNVTVWLKTLSISLFLYATGYMSFCRCYTGHAEKKKTDTSAMN